MLKHITTIIVECSLANIYIADVAVLINYKLYMQYLLYNHYCIVINHVKTYYALL